VIVPASISAKTCASSPKHCRTCSRTASAKSTKSALLTMRKTPSANFQPSGSFLSPGSEGVVYEPARVLEHESEAALKILLHSPFPSNSATRSESSCTAWIREAFIRSISRRCHAASTARASLYLMPKRSPETIPLVSLSSH
jgi:hypothetical protein